MKAPRGAQRRRWLQAVGRLAAASALPAVAACGQTNSRDVTDPGASARAAAQPGRAPDSLARWARQQVRRATRPPLQGAFVGASYQRGHRLRAADAAPRPAPPAGTRQRTRVAIVGSGISALSVARALRRSGSDDFRIFELEDAPGGNARSGTVAGFACPWGAHYLPVPDPSNTALRELVVELGLARRDGARLIYDERALCHAPQERLLIDGQWQTGLLPEVPEDSAAQRDYRRFAELIADLRGRRKFPLPSSPRAPLTDPHLRDLDRQSFANWLSAQDLRGADLRWYVDYCCRDDYGAGIEEVSAWAGLHYFASRHGFFDSIDARNEEAERAAAEGDDLSAVLTWPEGNGWLAARLAQPLRERIVTGALVTALDADGIDVWRAATDNAERWQADHVVLAVPLFIAARLLAAGASKASGAFRADFEAARSTLAELAPHLRYACWRVANVHLDDIPQELPGAARAWDNMIRADLNSGALGYVDAMHQSLRSRPGPTVLTCYHAFGAGNDARERLLHTPWGRQADDVLDSLQIAHPNIRDVARQVDIMRWGHAMLVPSPGLRSSEGLARLREPFGNLHFAHSDLAGYSVFEEAFAIGSAVGARLKT